MSVADVRVPAARRAASAQALLLVFIAGFVLAAIPRLSARDQFITSDEDQWMSRSGGFAYALTTGELRRTYQNGHPGVTTMWLGVLSMGQERAYQFADRVHRQRLVAAVPGFWDALVQARIGPAIVTAMAAGLIGVLTARLWGAPVGILAGGISALDPWAVGLQQLLHTDGLLASFMGVSSLAALIYWWDRGPHGYLLIAGLAAGLALLSKTPALFLGPMTLAIAFISWRAGRSSVSRTVGGMAAFGALTLATFIAAWPAMWLAPLEMVGRMLAFLRETGGEADEVGSFFFGQAMGDPGPLYYPVALAFRLTPGLLLGLLGVVVGWRSIRNRGALGIIALFVVGFSLMMILSPKKFDRYLLPIEPMLGVLAAVGAIAAARRLTHRHPDLVAFVCVLGLQAAVLISVYPYYLAYFNPLLGGGASAVRSVMVGNGEGLDQAARWLNDQPDASNLWVAGHSYDILQGMYVGSGEPLRERVPSQADYILLYGRRIQMRRWGPLLEQYLISREPVHSVTINGVEFVRIYSGPKLEARSRGS